MCLCMSPYVSIHDRYVHIKYMCKEYVIINDYGDIIYTVDTMHVGRCISMDRCIYASVCIHKFYLLWWKNITWVGCVCLYFFMGHSWYKLDIYSPELMEIGNRGIQSILHAWITYDNLNAQAPVIFQRTSSSIIPIPLWMMVVSFMPTCDRVFV